MTRVSDLVRVKALSWGVIHTTNEWRGNSGIVRAYIIREKDGFYRWSKDNRQNWYCGTLPDNPEYRTLEAAKAAAQADYERRILSALEPEEADEGLPAHDKGRCRSIEIEDE